MTGHSTSQLPSLEQMPSIASLNTQYHTQSGHDCSQTENNPVSRHGQINHTVNVQKPKAYNIHFVSLEV